MSTKDQKQVQSREELENLIAKAIKKVAGKKENDLCKYIPGPSGGYMHHFTLRKLKNSDPAQLGELLKEYIVESSKPKALDPKPRAPRGSRKRHDFVRFSRNDIERVIELARSVGDSDLVARFSPKRSLAALKRELIRTIRNNKVNEELWKAYAETIATLEATEALLGNS